MIIEVIERVKRVKFIQHFVLTVQPEKGEISLFGQTEQAAEEQKQASRTPVCVSQRFSTSHSSRTLHDTARCLAAWSRCCRFPLGGDSELTATAKRKVNTFSGGIILKETVKGF